MSRHFKFTQSDLTRAIRGAQGGGMLVAQVEIEPNGKIVLLVRSDRLSPEPSNPWDAELKHN